MDFPPPPSSLSTTNRALSATNLALGFILETMTDPWENIRSSTTENIVETTSLHLKDVCSFYNIGENVCMVLGKITHASILCSHILPAHTFDHELEHLKLQREDINNPRNFLRLHRDIERAFDHKRLYFDYVSGPSPLRLCVVLLDPSLRSENLRFEDGTTKSFSDIADQVFSYEFIDDRKPFLQLLSLHATHVRTKARNQGWIPDPGGISSRIARNLELARLSLKPNHGEVMKAFLKQS